METYDVIVLGLGAAGIAAAIEAHDAGSSVVVLEKMPPEQAGGNSRVSGQVWFNADKVDRAEVYLRSLCGEYELPDALVSAWARETSGNTEWILARANEVKGTVPRDEGDPYMGDPTWFETRSHGQELRNIGWRDVPDSEFPELDGSDCGADYNYFGGSQGYSRLWLTMHTALVHRGIPVEYGQAGRALVSDESGAVIGVRTSDRDGREQEFSARQGVVVATGGFANNSEMARSFLRLSYVTAWGSPASTGDGIKMAQKVGADLSHPYNYMSMPGLRMPPYETGEFGQPADHRFILVGRDGKRFVDENEEHRHGKLKVRGEFDFYPGFPMWTIFDENARLAGPLVPPRENFAASWMKQVEGYRWSDDNSAEVERGWIVRADTLQELAEKLEISPEGLEQQVADWNAAVDAGVDEVWGRPQDSMHRVDAAPYYGYRWAQLLITTLGGIRKDEHGRALDPYGEPIVGLYAAGDTASTYSWNISGGLGLSDAIAFGRIGARHAAGQPSRLVEPATTTANA